MHAKITGRRAPGRGGRPLSKGTVTATVFVNVNHDHQFVYGEAGVIVTCFAPDQPGHHSGADPDRLLSPLSVSGGSRTSAFQEDRGGMVSSARHGFHR
ncbi:DUF6461 domain-containing protein [Nonomuraea sp. 10N515B]|uniref:DUF6461 domain-containing protein n=1 Tax=Nonomuraea sp. 10N515B TaxID=3457422 RepID=UPI003FCDE1C3